MNSQVNLVIGYINQMGTFKLAVSKRRRHNTNAQVSKPFSSCPSLLLSNKDLCILLKPFIKLQHSSIKILFSFYFQENIEKSLRAIHDVATRSWGTLCVTEHFRMLTVPLSTARFEGARQKADLAATLLKDLGIAHHNGRYISNENDK